VIENAFQFESFGDELRLWITISKSSDAARDGAAIKVLPYSRNRPKFGNAGELENLLGVAKNY